MTENTEPKRTKKPKRTQEEIDALKAAGVERTTDQDRFALRRKVRIFYDLQRMRMQVAGRTQKKADGAEIQLHPYDLATLEKRAQDLHVAETAALADVEEHLGSMSFYTEVLLKNREKWRGLGPTLAGVLLSEFDVRIADTVSKFWAFAGLAPVPAWRCRKCNTVVEAEPSPSGVTGFWNHGKSVIPCEFTEKTLADGNLVYTSGKAMRPTKGEKLPYNSFLRTKIVGVLAPNLLKLGSPYRKSYDDFKHRWESAGKGKSDAHRHQAAMRYMVKTLLADFWEAWRRHAGLPVRPSYAEEKLNKPPHSGAVAVGS
jgi:hypothetical protein